MPADDAGAGDADGEGVGDGDGDEEVAADPVATQLGAALAVVDELLAMKKSPIDEACATALG